MRKKQRQKIIKLAVSGIVAIVVVAVAILAAYTQMAPEQFGTGQGLFGLFGTGVDDARVSTGLIINYASSSSEQKSVTGYGEPLQPVYFLSETHDAWFSINNAEIQLGPSKMYADEEVRLYSYWWTLDFKEGSGSYVGSEWEPVITKTEQKGFGKSQGSKGFVHTVSGDGERFGGYLRVKSDEQVTLQTPLSFKIYTGKRTGAIRLQLHCTIKWTAWGEFSHNSQMFICLTDEAYLVKRATAVQPTGEDLTVRTEPGAYVDVSRLDETGRALSRTGKTASGSGMAVFQNLPSGTYDIISTKLTYCQGRATINFPETKMVTIDLSTLPPLPNELVVRTVPWGCDVELSPGQGSKNSGVYSFARWSNVPVGVYTVIVSKQGYITQEVAVTIPYSGQMYITLEEEAVPPSQTPTPPASPPPAAPAQGNQKPVMSGIQGLSKGIIGTSYSFTAIGSDPDGDILRYRFVWGDGTSTGWLENPAANHVFALSGTYYLVVQATDGKLNGESSRFAFTAEASSEGNILTVPLVEARNTQIGVYSTAIIKVQTIAKAEEFDISVQVTSQSGRSLVKETITKKSEKAGVYTATVSFKSDEEGIITIRAQAISKTANRINSAVAEKQVYCTRYGVVGQTPDGGQYGLTGEHPGPEVATPGFETLFVLFGIVVVVFVTGRRRRE